MRIFTRELQSRNENYSYIRGTKLYQKRFQSEKYFWLTDKESNLLTIKMYKDNIIDIDISCITPEAIITFGTELNEIEFIILFEKKHKEVIERLKQVKINNPIERDRTNYFLNYLKSLFERS